MKGGESEREHYEREGASVEKERGENVQMQGFFRKYCQSVAKKYNIVYIYMLCGHLRLLVSTTSKEVWSLQSGFCPLRVVFRPSLDMHLTPTNWSHSTRQIPQDMYIHTHTRTFMMPLSAADRMCCVFGAYRTHVT